MTQLIIRKPDDFHNHLRQGDLMPHMVRETAKIFARTNVMPNTTPPIFNAEDVKRYHDELKAIGTDLQFLMTFKVMPETTPQMIPSLKAAGAVAGKLYPLGVTTNSQDGVSDIEALFPTFKAMEEANLVLCLHGEAPEEPVDLKREEAFLPRLKKIAQNFPRLRIVLEHVSTKAAAEAVKSLPDSVAATVSVHHLLLTVDDVREHGKITHPHHLCMPICKTEADRQALLETIFSGHPKFFLGTDSAPHLRIKKESDQPPAGCYTTPVAIPLLAELFENAGKLEKLEAFTSKFGADFYQLSRNTSTITLVKESWTVPEEYFGVVPLKAGEELQWQVRL